MTTPIDPHDTDQWYVMPDSGGEYAVTTMDQAWAKFRELGVAGRVEKFSAGTGTRYVVSYHTDYGHVSCADGAWADFPSGEREGYHFWDDEGVWVEDEDREEDEDLNVGSIVFSDHGSKDELPARYAAAHAVIMVGDYASLQADIDSGAIWSMGDGAVALALKLLIVGAVMAPSDETFHPDGPRIPTVWTLDGTNGRGSIQGAEAYIANEAVKN
ncbi:MAG: hypothetical protein QOK02_3403 [Mycobacterium sp.]|jgi:hypothetical protein|nr:hypothetical protein [Mycobacterium sp.]